MPKKAFFSLPAKEQDAFFDTALGHFAQVPYDQASLSSLLRECGMAKGTYYLYFTNKLDLYEYLVDTVLTMKTIYIKTRLVREPPDFFHLFESLLRLETNFRLEHPTFQRLLAMALDKRFSPLPVARINELEKQRDQQFHGMLVRDQLKGKISVGTDAQMITFLSGLMLEEFHRFVKTRMNDKKSTLEGTSDGSAAQVTVENTRRFMQLFRKALASASS